MSHLEKLILSPVNDFIRRTDTLNDIGVGSIQLLMVILDVKRDNNRY